MSKREKQDAERALTPRQREIAMLVAEGLTNKQIARRLNLTEGTVKLHLHSIYSKTGVQGRTALAILTMWPGQVVRKAS